MLNVQQFLRSNGGDLQKLTELYGIKVREYPLDNVIVLNYDQIESPKSEPIVLECRSLVLAMDTFDVVSMKFSRFFNYGECPHLYVDFDISGSLLLEKADGSLVGFNHSPFTGRWEISTRSMYRAEGEHILGGTFRDKILSGAGFCSDEEFQDWSENILSEELTYIFEWVSPENRIVTPYEKSELVLLGVSNKNTLEYHTFSEMSDVCESLISFGLNVRMPKCYPSPESKEHLVEMVNSLPDLQEGFILWCEKTGRRMKMKSTNYLIAHRLRGENTIPTRKNVAELILTGEVEEFLCYFPEYDKYISPVRAEIEAIEKGLKKTWERVSGIVDQKEFAISVKDVPGNAVLFSTRKLGLDDPVKVFHDMELNKKLRMIGC